MHGEYEVWRELEVAHYGLAAAERKDCAKYNRQYIISGRITGKKPNVGMTNTLTNWLMHTCL
jgi:hypothetical protein